MSKITKKLFFITLIILAIAVEGCTSNDGSSSVKLTSPIKNCKTVNVPYQEQVAYTEQEPYTALEDQQVTLQFEVTKAISSTTDKGFDIWAYGEVTVKNVDSETGSFTVEQTFTTLNKPSSTMRTTNYIMSGESKIFREEYDIKLGEDFNMKYVVQPGTKTVTKQVTKYRTETKYRQEEQCD